MKKGLLFILVLTVMTSSKVVGATPPLDEVGIVVEFDNCELIPDYDKIYIDVLLDDNDIYEGNLSDIILSEYIESFPNYEVYDFLVYEDYRSVRAYVNQIGYSYNHSRIDCTHKIDYGDSVDEFYLVIFHEDGTVLYNQLHNHDQLGYLDKYNYIGTMEYDYDNNEITYVRTWMGLGISGLFIYPFLVLTVIPLFTIVSYLLHKKIYNRKIDGNQSYKNFLIIAVVTSFATSVGLLQIRLYQSNWILALAIPLLIHGIGLVATLLLNARDNNEKDRIIFLEGYSATLVLTVVAYIIIRVALFYGFEVM